VFVFKNSYLIQEHHNRHFTYAIS